MHGPEPAHRGAGPVDKPAMTEEQDLAALSFKAAAHDLELIVRHIAGRYIHQRVPLTWRLLHAIEAEALADLGFASRHDAGMRQCSNDSWT